MTANVDQRETPGAAPRPAVGRGSVRTRGETLQVSGLTKSFLDARQKTRAFAIEDISFEVPKGSFFSLVGPSGCGKTTTLRCIAGLENADRGEVRIGDAVVFSTASRRNLSPEERPIALVPQSYGIWPHMSVYDVAAFPFKHGRFRRAHRRGNRQATKRRVMEMLEVVGLDHAATRWSTQLSGGQQQRLALARALLCEPDLLLLDEPLSNLDAKLRSQLRTELKSFQQDFGVTTLYVTHDQSEALALSDSLAVLNAGRVEQVGSPKAIYDSPRSSFVADFLGSANLVPGTLVTPFGDDDEVHVRTAFGVVRCMRFRGEDSGTDGTSAVDGNVCIRPEDIDVQPATTGQPSQPNALTGTAVSVEFLGHMQHMIVDLSGTKLHAYLPPSTACRQGDPVIVTVRPDRALYLSR
ncbi:ABC transporter ATP-binding protein [Phytohabitans sp. ZYX-F-186]|uniref:ABC transporter ATP-binding protein n=1 Tax=Phytohabitans maris TaxID=3071409 RepID=A0ABU0ZNR4_9ACTN|nr:ABC transporter ATP-binding protein [Phytohabitans sp. ZYX-F-186]MDQ7907567.1 ABC transporter ATP-binding protein [Phytohabitans sp. ZYX-F-186]